MSQSPFLDVWGRCSTLFRCLLSGCWERCYLFSYLPVKINLCVFILAWRTIHSQDLFFLFPSKLSFSMDANCTICHTSGLRKSMSRLTYTVAAASDLHVCDLDFVKSRVGTAPAKLLRESLKNIHATYFILLFFFFFLKHTQSGGRRFHKHSLIFWCI